jgi:RNAse (barnase) inhibitor barstar
MSLDEADRKELDYAIESATKYVTEMRFLFRQEEVKTVYRDEIDFLFDYLWGMIITTFKFNFKSVLKRNPTSQQQADAIRIMITRAKEIRDMITRTG